MRHHYIPQFLLRCWTDTALDGKLEVFRLDLGDLRSSRRAARFTGFEEDLYALSKPVVAGMERHAIEQQFLRHVDHLAAIVRRKLDEQGLQALTPGEGMDWVRFLMSLQLRNPDIIHSLRDEAAQHLRATLSAQPEQYEELARDEDPPTLEEWTEQHFPGLIENFGLSFFHRLVDNPDIGIKILRMRWWLWNFSNVQHDLLLADRPCIFTTGIDDPNLIIALPISPKKAFMATQGNAMADIMRRQDPKRLVSLLNEASVGQARVRIYACNTSPARFISNRLSRRTGSTR